MVGLANADRDEFIGLDDVFLDGAAKHGAVVDALAVGAVGGVRMGVEMNHRDLSRAWREWRAAAAG